MMTDFTAFKSNVQRHCSRNLVLIQMGSETKTNVRAMQLTITYLFYIIAESTEQAFSHQTDSQQRSCASKPFQFFRKTEFLITMLNEQLIQQALKTLIIQNKRNSNMTGKPTRIQIFKSLKPNLMLIELIAKLSNSICQALIQRDACAPT